ncbi:MAG: Ig-like domain-containing protein, partial [Gemmatimonadales bacterium]
MHSRSTWSSVLTVLPLLAACEQAQRSIGPDSDPLARIVVSPKSVALAPYQTQQFQAFGLTAAGDTVSAPVSWSTSAGTITSSGLYTAGQVAGTYHVIAAHAGGSLRDTSTVSVTTIPVASVSVNPATASVQVGATVQLTATPKDASGTPLGGRVVTWATSNTAAATVNGGGLVTAVAAGSATITATSEGKSGTASLVVTATGALPVDTVFAEDFESGTLSAWADGVDPTRHRVVTDPSGAQAGSRYLEVTYPAGGDGGWLTRFFMPGYDSLYVSAYVRFPTTWLGSTKLIAFYGSRTDNQWSAFGQAGNCPTGTDFFAAMVVSEPAGGVGTRFYTYYPAMARQPDGVTCWGRYGDGTETYVAPLTMSLGAWHRVEFWVKLNTPGQANASQTFWLDGVERGRWSGFSFRSSTILRLNAVQLTFSAPAPPQTQKLYVDNLVVSTWRPAEGAATNPPPANPGTVTDLAVSGVTDSSATLAFTEVHDGTGLPASYFVRYAKPSLAW